MVTHFHSTKKKYQNIQKLLKLLRLLWPSVCSVFFSNTETHFYQMAENAPVSKSSPQKNSVLAQSSVYLTSLVLFIGNAVSGHPIPELFPLYYGSQCEQSWLWVSEVRRCGAVRPLQSSSPVWHICVALKSQTYSSFSLVLLCGLCVDGYVCLWKRQSEQRRPHRG